ncbi:MAG: hypothetical protein ABIG39_00495 [Candidatus Micrarchaeota archaeon]
MRVVTKQINSLGSTGGGAKFRKQEYLKTVRIHHLEMIEVSIADCIRLMEGGPYDATFVKQELERKKENILNSIDAMGKNTGRDDVQRLVFPDIRELVEKFSLDTLQRAHRLTCGLKLENSSVLIPSQKGA